MTLPQAARDLVAKWRPKFNRVISDVRCAIGRRLIALGAWITDASVHSHRGATDWDWKVSTKRSRK